MKRRLSLAFGSRPGGPAALVLLAVLAELVCSPGVEATVQPRRALRQTPDVRTTRGVETEARLQVPVFRITLPVAAARQIAELGLETPVHGRVYVVLSADGGREPRSQVRVVGAPFWGEDVQGLRGGLTISLQPGAEGVVGYPADDMRDIPPGEYRAQAVLNVYTTFHRSDGHTVSLHLNSGAGQDLWRSPGNAYSAPVRLVVRGHAEAGGAGPGTGRDTIALSLDSVIGPLEAVPSDGSLQQGNPIDHGLVRYVKIESERLSRFWGRKMWIGANILLPADYDSHPDRHYPVVYLQGHFPGRSAPFGYGGGRGRSSGFDAFWRSADAPRVIAVTFRHANPYYDDSYAVNSANVGPYGDALIEDLIPYIESRFRTIRAPWARVLAGGSTGGWEALALQIFHPRTFGGTWGWCPDPVDFHDYQIVDVYHDPNAYVVSHGAVRVPRPGARGTDGSVRYTMEQENRWELAQGEHARSGGQWDIWQAVFGPVGPDGYPAPIWDKRTGAIHQEVARYWGDHFDLHAYLRRNWSRIGPSLEGKIHVAVGDMDTYYLNNAVYRLQAFMDSTSAPPARASFEYGRLKPHCYIGHSRTDPDRDLGYPEFIRIAAGYMAEHAPAGAELNWRGGVDRQ